MNRYFSDCHAVKFKIEIKRIYTTDGDMTFDCFTTLSMSLFYNLVKIYLHYL